MSRLIEYNEVQKHNNPQSCWVILYDHVYDVTDFLPHHPGGANLILQLAGQDATAAYDPVHPSDTLEQNLKAEDCVGKIDRATVPVVDKKVGGKKNKRMGRTKAKMRDGEEVRLGGEKGLRVVTAKGVAAEKGDLGEKRRVDEKVGERTHDNDDNEEDDEDEDEPLDSLLNLDDIERAATKRLSYRAWAYYFSAADDLVSKSLNNRAYRSILMRPRIFIDVNTCNLSTTLLGNRVSMPLFVCPAAMARLAHPDGEHGIARACGAFGALQIMSNNASQTPEQIVAGARPDQVFGWQLYILKLREKSEAMLARIAQIPQIKFICLTLDVPAHGKREHDERIRSAANTLQATSVLHVGGDAKQSHPASRGGEGDAGGEKGKQAYGIGKSLFQGTASDMTWRTTLPWLLKHSQLPLVLKGIQTYEDAYLASLCAPQVKAIILSNHGGRALDTAPPAVHTLLEIRKHCPEVFDKVEVWVDGGIKRGTDVVKALCLGARGVGIGRAALFGLGAGGIPGVERVLEILRSEIETCMRLLGVRSVEELGMQHINTRMIEQEIYDGPPGVMNPSMILSRPKL